MNQSVQPTNKTKHLGALEELAQMMSYGINDDTPPTSDQQERVRAWLAANPDQWRDVGELAEYATNTVIDSATSWAIERESVRRKLQELKAELGYESSNHVERMMIEQAALCWVRLYFLERALANATKGSHNKELAHYWDRRVTSAQHRFNQALVSLAKIRKLKLPNITAIQANVAYVNANDSPVGMQAKQLLTTGD